MLPLSRKMALEDSCSWKLAYFSFNTAETSILQRSFRKPHFKNNLAGSTFGQLSLKTSLPLQTAEAQERNSLFLDDSDAHSEQWGQLSLPDHCRLSLRCLQPPPHTPYDCPPPSGALQMSSARQPQPNRAAGE